MYNWRFLILALLAALHPISSFSERSSVDGRGQCCDKEPTSLSRETRLSYGSHRLWETTAKDNRLNLNQNVRENRRSEIDYSVVRGSIGERRLADRWLERDIGRVSREHFRLTRDDVSRAEAREDDRRQRESTSVESDAHKITSRYISRLKRDRLQDSRTFSTRANNARNRFSKESRRDSQNRDVHSEFGNQENRKTRDLLQRARDDVISGARRDQPIRRDSIRYSGLGLSRSLEQRENRASRRTRQELNRNEFRLNREHDSVRDPEHRLSRSLDRREYRSGDRMEPRNELHRIEFRLNRVYDSQNSKNRVRDFRQDVRVTDSSNQRTARKEPSVDRLSSGYIYETRDLKEQRLAAERFSARRALSSRQDTKVQEETRSDRRAMKDNDRRATREMANNRVQRSRPELRQMNRRQLSGQNDRRMYERNMEDRRFRSQSLHLDNKREYGQRLERERASVDHVRDERRLSPLNIRSSLTDDRRKSVDRGQKEIEIVDRVHRRESRLNIRGVRSTLDKNLRQDSRQRERDSVNRVHDERRETRISVRGVRNSFDESRRLSVDRRERDSGDRVRNERIKSRLNIRKVRRVRDDDERRLLRRDTVTRVVLNREQHDRETPKTMQIRDVRQDSREQRSRESGEKSRDVRLGRREIVQSIRNDDRQSRASNRRERNISESRLIDKSIVEPTFSRHSRRTENRISRNLESNEYRFRSDVRLSENRDNFVLRYKTKGAKNIATITWQYLFYTLQAIYLCGIFAKMLSKDENEKKTRSLQWWNGPSHNLVKVD